MHRISSRAALAALLLLFTPFIASAQTSTYHDHASLGRRLEQIAREHPERVAVRSIATTGGRRDVWAVTIGGPGADARPAVLIVAGVDGPRRVGSELALRFVERLAADRSDSLRQLLARTTFYVIPSASPDALAGAVETPRHARATNLTPRDDDRDGAVDEDGVDDLDGNGVITQMRVRGAVGRYLADPLDARFVREADASRGERGVYEIHLEGRDNDRDGQYNEDDRGGVDINRNFTFGYRAFAPGSGEHAISEIESRALADFCFDHQNIAAVFAFSSQANLLHPWEARPEAGAGAGRIVRTVRDADREPLARLAKLYGETTGQKGGPASYVKGEGSFLEWAYYHFGRVAVGAPGWQLALDKAKDTTAPVVVGADTLAWLERNGLAASFVPWRRIEHPDFPGREVEVGGMIPFAAVDPPAAMLDSLGASHAKFLQRLGSLLPALDVVDVRSEPLGDGLTRVYATVANTGFLPTLLAMGETSRVPLDVKAELKLANGQTVAAGRRVQLLGPVAGGGASRELSWVVAGNGSLRIVIGGPMTGTVERTVELGR
jgi:hypothetical protein